MLLQSFMALAVLGVFILVAVAWFLVGASRTYTQRGEERAELSQTKEHYHEVIESSREAIISINEKLLITQWNEAGSKVFGYAAEEAIDQPIGMIISEECVETGIEGSDRFLEPGSGRGDTKMIVTEGKRKDGSTVPIEFSLSALSGRGLWTFTLIIRDIMERKQIEAQQQVSYRIQIALNRLLRISLEKTSLGEVLQQSLEEILSVPCFSSLSKGAIFLTEDDALSMKTHRGLADPITSLCSRVEFGECLCGLAASSKGLVFADCVDERHTVGFDGMPSHGHYCVPMVADGDVLGVIDLQLTAGHLRDKSEEEFLLAAANVMVGAINARKAEESLKSSLRSLRDAMGGTIQLLSSTLEARDPYTAGHQRRVADLSRSIAKEMGLPDNTIDGLRMGALIHDIGKIGLPAEILSKPGKISPVEMLLIQSHPEVGYNLLRETEFPWPVSQMVYQHHEKMDGSGYPQGLSGEDICIEARILCVADVVEAISSHRPYRVALGIDLALEEIEKHKGALYDPQAAEACLRLFRKHGYEMKQAG